MTQHLGPRVPDRPDKAESAERNALAVRMLCIWHGIAGGIDAAVALTVAEQSGMAVSR